jgi:adenosylcobinamide kinase / adenosylcobinamide-phosphate guanylyltransferase
MPLTLLIGGARSGKSELATRLSEREGTQVVVIATGQARDPEMAARIACHKAARPPHWEVIEEPVELGTALSSVPQDACALIDCLTLWVSNLMERGLADSAIEVRARDVLSVVAAREGSTIAVTNEVGSGIVPLNAQARRFRDLLGRVNALWARASERPLLMSAGCVVALQSPDAYLDG